MRIADFADYCNAIETLKSKRPRAGVFCENCGLEISHGIKNNTFCSKPCFYEAMSKVGAERNNPYETAREIHTRTEGQIAISEWR